MQSKRRSCRWPSGPRAGLPADIFRIPAGYLAATPTSWFSIRRIATGPVRQATRYSGRLPSCHRLLWLTRSHPKMFGSARRPLATLSRCASAFKVQVEAEEIVCELPATKRPITARGCLEFGQCRWCGYGFLSPKPCKGGSLEQRPLGPVRQGGGLSCAAAKRTHPRAVLPATSRRW